MLLEVDRQDFRHVRLVTNDTAPLSAGTARLRIDTFGLTANNITYAVFGGAMNYWSFFPATGADGGRWGRVPVWGFADVVESRTPALEESTRVYGYFPLGSELVVEPGRIDDSGFTDVIAHRRPLPSVYNRYAFVDADPVYHPDREAQQILLWPLFVTSFVVDDFFRDHDQFGADRVLISSASAKTSVAAAFLLSQRAGVEVLGLTSDGNLDFVQSLGCYHDVLPYGSVNRLPLGPACYVDVAGRRDVTAAVHAHFGDLLGHSMVVGDTHWDHQEGPTDRLEGPRPAFLFAPDRIAKRRREWGRKGFEQAVAGTWERFSPWTDAWLSVRAASGPAEVEAAYRSLLEGQVDPRVGHVCTMGPATVADRTAPPTAGAADRTR